MENLHTKIVGDLAKIKLKSILKNKDFFYKDYIKSKNILDIGCADMIETISDYDNFVVSNDFLHKRLVDIAGNVLGVDINETAINILKKHGYNILKLNLLNNEEIKKISNIYFDTVILHHVIEHIPNYYAFLEKVVKDIQFDSIIFGLPNSQSLSQIGATIFLRTETVSNDHYHSFTPITAHKLISSFGLEIIELSVEKLPFKLQFGKKFKILGLIKNLFTIFYPYGDIVIIARKIRRSDNSETLSNV